MSLYFVGVVTFHKPGLVLVVMSGLIVQVSRVRVRACARARPSPCICRELRESFG